MRRLLLLSAILLASPAVGLSDDGPTATLTLKGPGATTYGHEIDLVGRLSPAAAGVRVRLLRGSQFLTVATTTATGSFLFKVAVARPGPFHAEASGAASP